jgi:juvenile-hormone esterase
MDSSDVIFVTMNYRLGPLGFLSTGDSHMPGNFGLKDQALAIEWVKKNIQYFGGDDRKITLMGQSAGASSVHLHMMSSSEWARDSFQRAVMLSGNGNGPYAYVIKNPSVQAREFAKHSKIERYNELDTRALANELRTSKPEDLINACDKFKYWSIDPLTISRPVVENCEDYKGFLCDDPMDLWKNGNYAKVPFLSGFMDNDGGVRALGIISNQTLINELNNNYMELIPKLMEVDNEKATDEYKKLLVKKIEEKYFHGHFKVRNDSDALNRLYNDRAFFTPFYNMYNQHVNNDRSTPSYMYKFSVQGPVSWAPIYSGSFNNLGYNPIHADELVYMIKSPAVFQQNQNFPKDSELGKFRSEFVEFLTFFAYQG